MENFGERVRGKVFLKARKTMNFQALTKYQVNLLKQYDVCFY